MNGDPATPVTTPPTARFSVLGGLALVLALLALALALMAWQRLSAMREQLARQSADTGVQAVEARAIARQAQELARDTAARLGIGCLKFSQGPWDQALPEVHAYRDKYREFHAEEAPPLLISDIVSCFADERKARDYAVHYMGLYHQSVLSHYEMTGTHFKDMPSYASYAAGAEALKRDGAPKALEAYIDANLAGTPEQIVENLQRRAEVIGDSDLSLNVSYGGMSYEDVWEQAKLFADKVMPHLV